MTHLPRRLVELASRPYAPAGAYARHFAAGKLAGDPVFVHLLRHGLLAAPGARLLDLGCGQGLLGTLCRAAATLAAEGHWPAGWAPPPLPLGYRGIELVAKDVARGRQALPAQAPVWTIEAGDLRTAELGQAELVVVLDVLHYLPAGDQGPLLSRIHAALPVGGRLIARLGDASGRRMALAGWIDRLIWLGRSHRRPLLHHRPIAQWKTLIAGLGFEIEHCAPVAGERFGNQLLVARRLV